MQKKYRKIQKNDENENTENDENTENENRTKLAEIIIQQLDDKTYTFFHKFLLCEFPYFTLFQRNFNIATLLYILFCLYYFLFIFVEL